VLPARRVCSPSYREVRPPLPGLSRSLTSCMNRSFRRSQASPVESTVLCDLGSISGWFLDPAWQDLSLGSLRERRFRIDERARTTSGRAVMTCAFPSSPRFRAPTSSACRRPDSRWPRPSDLTFLDSLCARGVSDRAPRSPRGGVRPFAQAIRPLGARLFSDRGTALRLFSFARPGDAP